MAKKDALRLHAEMLFIELGMSAKEIAVQLDVTEKTIGNWRKAGDWDKRRDELLSAPHKIKELLQKELLSVLQGNDAKLNADSISKLSKALDSIDDKINPRIVTTVIKMLDDYQADTNPELAGKCLESHKNFILHIINING